MEQATLDAHSFLKELSEGRIGRACLGQQGSYQHRRLVTWDERNNILRIQFGRAPADRRASASPTEVSIELTHRCPLECQHCYNNLPMADKTARNSELTLEEYKRLLDEIAAAGTFWVLFTGGEIFARADFLDYLRVREIEGFPDHAVHQRHHGDRAHRELSGGVPAVRD